MASIFSNRLPPPPLPEKIAEFIQEQYTKIYGGISIALAVAIALGAFRSRTSVKVVARRWKLIAEPDTTEARKKGLIQ